MRAIRFHLQECLLTVLFIGAFIAVLMFVWEEAGFFYLQPLVAASIVLPMLYLVLLLMIRQHRERRQKLKKGSSTPWDGEF